MPTRSGWPGWGIRCGACTSCRHRMSAGSTCCRHWPGTRSGSRLAAIRPRPRPAIWAGGARLARFGRRRAAAGDPASRSARLESHRERSDGLVLIDWECAAVSDPLLDVACILSYHESARPYASAAAAALRARRRLRPAQLAASVWLFDLHTYLWYRERRLRRSPTDAEREPRSSWPSACRSTLEDWRGTGAPAEPDVRRLAGRGLTGASGLESAN